jgi:hypothetical protein
MATIGDVLVTVEDIENYKAPVGGLGEDMRRVYSLPSRLPYHTLKVG